MISPRTQAELVPVSSLTAFSEVVPAAYAERLLAELAEAKAEAGRLAEALQDQAPGKNIYLSMARATVAALNKSTRRP